SWDVSPEDGGNPLGVISFRWGPHQSYIWAAQSLLGPDGSEHPHFEGMLMWNGVRKNLDMLLAIDLTYGRAQEQGSVSMQPDGSIVREIVSYFSEGEQTMDGRVVGPEG